MPALPETTVPQLEDKRPAAFSAPFSKHEAIQNSPPGLFSGGSKARDWETPSLVPQLPASRVAEIQSSHNPKSRNIVPSQDVLHEKSYSEPAAAFLGTAPQPAREAAIKGRVTMKSTFQWESIRCGGLGGMRVPGGSSPPRVGSQGLGGAEHPPRMVPVQPLSASQSPGDRSGGCGKTGWIQPWVESTEGDKPCGAAIWGVGTEMQPLSKAGGAVAGREVGKGLSAASGCGIRGGRGAGREHRSFTLSSKLGHNRCVHGTSPALGTLAAERAQPRKAVPTPRSRKAP